MADEKKKRESISTQAKKAIESRYANEEKTLYHVAGTFVKGKALSHFFAAVGSDGIEVYQFTDDKELIPFGKINWSDWQSVEIDHFAVKSNFVFKGNGEEHFVVSDGSGKRVEELIRQRTSVQVVNHSRKWYQKILGFRSGKKPKMIISSIVYLLIIFAIIGAVVGDGEEEQSTSTEKPKDIEVSKQEDKQTDKNKSSEAKEVKNKTEKEKNKNQEEI